MSGKGGGWIEQYRCLLPKAKAVVAGRSTKIDDLKNCIHFATIEGHEERAFKELGIDACRFDAILKLNNEKVAKDLPLSSEPLTSSPDVALRNIEQISNLLKQADELEKQRDRNEVAARRKRIDAALLMVEAEKSGIDRTKLYKAIGIHRKYGRAYFKLAEFYAGCDEKELDRRQAEGNLLSLNQATALDKAVEKLANGEEKTRLVKAVRDGDAGNLLDPDFGPRSIEQLAGGLSAEEHSLREALGIDQQRIDELKKTAPAQAAYDAEFKSDCIRIKAPSFPLVFAALTKTHEEAAKALEFFGRGGEFIIKKGDS